MGPQQIIPIWVWEVLEVMAMKKYSIFLKTPELAPHHQIQFSVIPRTLVGGGVLPQLKSALSVFYDPNRQSESISI